MTAAPGASPKMPKDADGPVFGAPWEARAFALAVQLSDRGVFTWSEWAAALAAEIAEAGAEAQGYEPSRDYYRCWLRALEHLLTSRGLLTAERLAASVAEALRTWPHPPHGARTEPVGVSPAGSAIPHPIGPHEAGQVPPQPDRAVDQQREDHEQH